MSEWISVDDRMPDDVQSCESLLVYCAYPACKEADVAYLDSDYIWCSEDSHKPIPVTHWMPLPEPPKDKL